jgi:hypothetical protein
MAGDTRFEIPARPARRFSSTGHLEYDGGTRFDLDPTDRLERPLAAVVESVLDTDPYRYGDFLELPMPVYLVRDDGTADVFRVAVRDGEVRLYVLPETDPAGLQAFFDRLQAASGVKWSVSRTVTETA